MAELQLILAGTGILVMLGLVLWSRYRDRLPRRFPVRLRSDDRREPVVDPVPAEAPPPPARPAPAPQVPPRHPAKIVTLRLMCRSREGFPGEQLILALREQGLRHGRYGIFHWGPPGGDEDDPVFSVANLVEPGSFDLTKVRTDRYPGVSIFMALPGPMDGVAAFDQLIETARALAGQLDADLLDEQGSTLSIQRQRYLREEIIQYQLRRPRLD